MRSMCCTDMTNTTLYSLKAPQTAAHQKNDHKLESSPRKQLKKNNNLTTMSIRSCSIAFNHKLSSIWSLPSFLWNSIFFLIPFFLRVLRTSLPSMLAYKVETEVKNERSITTLKQFPHNSQDRRMYCRVVALLWAGRAWWNGNKGFLLSPFIPFCGRRLRAKHNSIKMSNWGINQI